MVISQIQLGVKEGSEAYRDWLPSQGFFYGEVGEPGGVGEPSSRSVRFQQYPARQHLILQTICAGRRVKNVSVLKQATDSPESAFLAGRHRKSRIGLPAHLFYDNPNRKRGLL